MLTRCKQPQVKACPSNNIDSGGSEPQDLHDDALRPLPVELGIENPLPCAEIQASFGHREGRLVMQEKGFQVSVSIVLAGAVVFVAGPCRRELLKPGLDVLD